MIIVEGPDGAGKTTLLKRLEAHFDLPVAPRVVSKEAEAMVNLQHWVEHNLSLGWQAVLFDRHRLISEPIYGSILRNVFEPGFDDFEWLSAMYMKFYELKPIIIYCLPPYHTVRDNVRQDPDNKVVWQTIRKIYSCYVAQAARDAVVADALIYDYEQTPDVPTSFLVHIEYRLRQAANVRFH